MKHIFFLFLFLFSFISSQDNFLLKIGEEVIFPSEFLNIYNKNRTDSDTIINTDEIDEYLDLFINFKLKVIEAESLGMDTLASFKKELAGYRNQLSKSYLSDTKVTDELLQEAYERLKFEVNVSHILIALEATATPNDTLNALKKIKKIRKEYYNGASFEDLVAKYSDDPSSTKNNGELGYFSALRMVYPFESAAYNTKLGEVSEPIRTSYGFHLLKVNDKRESRGDVKVSHIMVVNDKKNKSDSLSKKKIFEIYNLINEGGDFSDLAKKHSDDKKSGSKGGELDWFGITNKVNMYESFSDASFNLLNIGDVSEPIKTPAGWHIIKLLDKKDLPPFSEIESTLKSRVEKDSRSQKSRNALIKRCKDFYSFKENKKYLSNFYKLSSQDFLQAKNSLDLLERTGRSLFSLSFNSQTIYFFQKDFADFILNFKNSFRNRENSKLIIDELYRMFVEQSIINFENQNLELRYNDFALLMDEYHDGILLFDLMNEKVWSKAVKDTLGLTEFYNSLISKKDSDNYFDPKRVVLKVYETYDEKTHKKLSSTIYKKISQKIAEDSFPEVDRIPKDIDEYLIQKFNKKSNLNLKIYEETVVINDLPLRSIKTDYDSVGIYYLKFIQDILPKSIKPLNSIKGLVISEYQNYLEKEWLDVLKQKYEIQVNQNILALLKQNKLIEINLAEKENNSIPTYQGSFSQAYRKAVENLGSSKYTYFKWRDKIYTTE